MSRPILPARLALDLLDEVRAFVGATLFARDTGTREAITRCLFEESPMVQGPFVQVRLPYRSTEGEAWPLHKKLRLPHAPYLHQLKAWKRLAAQEPEHTLVTTGTGSGKSECFHLPILDYVLRQKASGGARGVKALILYPMNALIDDQGERLAHYANDLNESFGWSGKDAIRIGRYTGGGGNQKEMDPKNPNRVIDSRAALCECPPDILLTNYRMLDFMLYRPEEQSFWDASTQDIFRYLVLDELHTFDGAQGADVACLIRRLRLKLQNKPFCCVGTSATIGSGDASELRMFATKLFGETFDEHSVVREDSLEKHEALDALDSSLPRHPKPEVALPPLVGGSSDTYETYVSALLARWGTGPDPETTGRWLLRHPLLHSLLDAQGQWETMQEAAKRCETTPATLAEFLDLVAWSRRPNARPLFPLQVQVWVQESRRLGRELAQEPSFVRMVAELNVNQAPQPHILPAVNCNECGAAGWITQFLGEWDSANSLGLAFDRRTIVRAYQQGKAHILFPSLAASEGDSAAVYYSRITGRLHKGNPDTADENNIPLVYRFQQNSDDRILAVKKGQSAEKPVYCPECDKRLALRMSAVSSSLLTSVLTGAYLSHPANPDDRKLLIFNDSVQDAAHQAGYVSHRSFRFGLRRLVAAIVKEACNAGTTTLPELIQRLQTKVESLCQQAQNEKSASCRSARMEIATLVPLDLWQRWEQEGESQHFFTPEVAKELSERLAWEAWFELTLNSSLGWSLRKTGQAGVEPSPTVMSAWLKTLNRIVLRLTGSQMEAPEAFVQGVLRRFISCGAIFHEDLTGCYAQKKYSLWPMRQRKSHLRSLFATGTSLPGVISLRGPSERTEREGVHWVMSAKGSATWFEQWGKRHGLKNPGAFYVAFFEELANAPASALRKVRKISAGDFVLDANALELKSQGYHIMKCNLCAHIEVVASSPKIYEPKCPQYRCAGKLVDANRDADAFRSYMQQYYCRPLVGTWAHTHTGQLDAADRRRVEEAFKKARLPGDKQKIGSKNKTSRQHPVNILSCTPTMEMGIDIGDLSAVFLRSFPRTIANANQRLGRSGRKTGNALNVALTKLVPHDLHYWNEPHALLKGRVATPGCEFTNKQVLWRQFNAFCLDCYAQQTECETLPRASEDDITPLAQHPFWLGFRTFLRGEAKTLLAPFLDEMFRNHPDKARYARQKALDAGFTSALEKELFWAAIETALRKIDLDLEQKRAERTRILESTNPPESQTLSYDNTENLGDGDTPQTEIPAAQERERARIAKAWESFSDEKYILATLGSQGVLPNYAFPEEGVQLQASIRLPSESTLNKKSEKPRYKSIAVGRPPMQALRELAPNQSYYLDGFKVPIVRIDCTPQKQSMRKVFCRECGQSSPIPGADELPEEVQFFDCIYCGAEDQPSLRVVDFTGAVACREFDNAQIRDTEDEREKKPAILETYINCSDGSSDEHSAWVSEEEGLGVEFKTQANIVLTNLGVLEAFNTPSGFAVCAECGAIPSHRQENGETILEFKGMGTENLNRHRYGCSHFSSPNGAPVTRIGLTREFRSDVIRFTAASRDEVPTLAAMLNFAMKVLLGGNPGHIEVSHAEHRTPGRGYRHIVTLFDAVPGGSGHLLSLMNFAKTPEKGLADLVELFKKTLAKLKSCACERGCYECLLSFDNQYQHDVIDKRRATLWLERFLSAKDWGSPGKTLTCETRENAVFDGYAEQFLVEGLEAGNRSGNFGIEGVEYFRPVKGADGYWYELGGSGFGRRVFLEATAERKIPLHEGVSPYTKPDFWIWASENDCEHKELVAYLYVDGRDAHLGRGEERASTLDRDVALRKQLAKESGLQVITLTYQMVQAWIDLRKNGELSPVVHTPKGEIHVLVAWLMAAFKPQMAQTSAWARLDSLSPQLFGSFVACMFLELLNPKKLWFPDKDSVSLGNFIDALSKENQVTMASSLSFVSKEKELILNASREHRCNEYLEILPAFARDWSAWWVLTQIPQIRSRVQTDSD